MALCFCGGACDFYPRSPCGERPSAKSTPEDAKRHFYPRSPCGERRLLACSVGSVCSFLSTLSLRRATIMQNIIFVPRNISIHALLAESDRYKQHRLQCNFNFYPRSPCGERLIVMVGLLMSSLYFYPRSPCGERRAPRFAPAASRNFYPRSPCGERPQCKLKLSKCEPYFYPRSPCGERRRKSAR